VALEHFSEGIDNLSIGGHALYNSEYFAKLFRGLLNKVTKARISTRCESWQIKWTAPKIEKIISLVH